MPFTKEVTSNVTYEVLGKWQQALFVTVWDGLLKIFST